MTQVFHPSMNPFSKVSILGILGLVALAGWLLDQWYRSLYVTQVNVVRAQPVQFSHEHHVGGLGIDCRYCHTSVETSSFAGIPPTQTCMNCHALIWNDSPKLEPVRASFRTGKPLAWTRVHDVPDFVQFNHSIHVNKGVGCASCHGRVDQMPQTWRAHSLYMEWCLDCHRHPEKHVRPRDEVFNMAWKPPADAPDLGKTLVDRYHVGKLTNCSVCHY
jgi:cytochrome c7-like protein